MELWVNFLPRSDRSSVSSPQSTIRKKTIHLRLPNWTSTLTKGTDSYLSKNIPNWSKPLVKYFMAWETKAKVLKCCTSFLLHLALNNISGQQQHTNSQMWWRLGIMSLPSALYQTALKNIDQFVRLSWSIAGLDSCQMIEWSTPASPVMNGLIKVCKSVSDWMLALWNLPIYLYTSNSAEISVQVCIYLYVKLSLPIGCCSSQLLVMATSC